MQVIIRLLNEDEINSNVATDYFNPNFSLFHLNARSLIGNLDQFKSLLDSTKAFFYNRTF